MLLPGCHAVHLRYHDEEGQKARLKVSPYWEGSDGEEYLVGGLSVVLHSKQGHGVIGENSSGKIRTVTRPDEPLVFDDLTPGMYRLKVYLDDDIKVSQDLELLAGKRLTVKIDVEGIEKREAFKESLEDIGAGIGEAVVIIGTVVLVVGIVALEIYLDDDDDDDKEGESLFHFP